MSIFHFIFAKWLGHYMTEKVKFFAIANGAILLFALKVIFCVGDLQTKTLLPSDICWDVESNLWIY